MKFLLQIVSLLLVLAYCTAYQLGNFQIKVVAEKLEVSIYHSLDPEKVQWKTLGNGQSFITALEGQADPDPIRNGEFYLKETTKDLTQEQTINSITSQQNSLVIEGVLTNSKFASKKCKVTYAMTFFQQDNTQENQLDFKIKFKEDENTCLNKNRILLTYWSSSEEQIYGMGTQYTYWNLKGNKIPVLVSEAGVTRGQQPLSFILNKVLPGAAGNEFTTYSPKPLYLTSEFRSVAVNNSHVTIFDFQKSDRISVEIFNLNMQGMIFVGSSPLDLVNAISDGLTGKMQPLPDWVGNGAILGIEGGSSFVQPIVDDLVQNYQVPIVAVWMQDWSGQGSFYEGIRMLWNWVVSYQQYPDWHKMIAKWKKWNIKPLIYINPNIANLTYLSLVQDVFQEAYDLDLFVKNQKGEVLLTKSISIEFAHLDFTNPKTREWFLNRILIQNMLGDAESEGWMSDFGEYLPFDAVLYNGMPASEYHNYFPTTWAQINWEAMNYNKSKEIIYFIRSAWLNSPQYTSVFWLGDQFISWDRWHGIKSSLPALFNSGITGHTINSQDIGGFTSIKKYFIFNYVRTKDLLFRWLELSAFSDAIFRTHPGIDPNVNQQVWSDKECILQFKKTTIIHTKLWPYKKQLMQEATQFGYPMVRHLWMHYWDDANVYQDEMRFQFMLGKDMIVRPVLDKETFKVDVYLPKGNWKHLFTRKVYNLLEEGQWLRDVYSPYGEPAAFCAVGSLACSVMEKLV